MTVYNCQTLGNPLLSLCVQVCMHTCFRTYVCTVLYMNTVCKSSTAQYTVYAVCTCICLSVCACVRTREPRDQTDKRHCLTATRRWRGGQDLSVRGAEGRHCTGMTDLLRDDSLLISQLTVPVILELTLPQHLTDRFTRCPKIGLDLN